MDSNLYNKVAAGMKKVLKGHRSEESAFDFINEAYLRLTEQGSEINEKLLYRTAKCIFLDQRHANKDLIGKDTNMICARCNQPKPAACFSVKTEKRLQIRRISSWCSDCHSEYSRQWSKTESGRASARKKVQNLTRSYLVNLLEDRGFNRNKITEAMIEEQRSRVLQHRARKSAKIPDAHCCPASVVSS